METWKPVVGYEGFYEVSDLGRVRSLWKGNKSRGQIIILKQKIHNHSCMVNLHKGGSQKTYRVHRLVADAFIPNPENLPDVVHIDGNPQNNVASNLKRCSEVATFAVIVTNHPGYNCAEKSSTATITNETALAIYRDANSGMKDEPIAEKYGVSRHMVIRIRCGYGWNSVTGHKKPIRRVGQKQETRGMKSWRAIKN